MTFGDVKTNELGPLAKGRIMELERKRAELVGKLRNLLDPQNKLGRWSPHYLPALLDLYRVEMQIDGFCFGQDLDVTDLPKLLERP
jgi:hypothetical protein